jgi:exportin-T
MLDNDLVTEAISQRAQTALDAYEAGTELPWETAELAIYLVFMYGELGGKDKGTLLALPSLDHLTFNMIS